MKYPWIAWYPAEYISKTRSLTMKQHGAYCLLLWEYYTNGPLLANASGLLNVCCSRTEEDREDVATVLKTFFFLEDGFWHHKRADEEIKKRRSISKQRQLIGRQGGLAKATRLLEQKPTQSQSQSQEHKTYSRERFTPVVEINPPLSEKSNGKTKYTQNDHDEKHLRLIAAAEKKISQSLQASIGRDTTITEQEFVVIVCQEVGITVERYFELKEKQKKWPSQITVL